MAELGKLEKHPCRETCEGCPFGGPKVGAKGNPKAPLVIVGESPGRQEVEGGMPFVGPSGQILHWNIPESDDIYCLNAMECSPKKDTKEQATIIKACHACHER